MFRLKVAADQPADTATPAKSTDTASDLDVVEQSASATAADIEVAELEIDTGTAADALGALLAFDDGSDLET